MRGAIIIQNDTKERNINIHITIFFVYIKMFKSKFKNDIKNEYWKRNARMSADHFDGLKTRSPVLQLLPIIIIHTILQHNNDDIIIRVLYMNA